MDRLKKTELIQRSLGLRHKLKVHETMKAPESHEDLSISLQARWELEDELRAIEELLADDRAQNVAVKKQRYEKEIKEANREADRDAASEEKEFKKKLKK